jgi:5-methylthioadenosine/S-adenosylhomocysteine deaminase
MNIRFYNARILTLSPNKEIVEGELWVEKDRISFIGTLSQEEGDKVWDREIDVQGNLLMPGFKNCHTHSPMTFLRSYADDLPLMDWLNNKVFPAEKALDKEDIFILTKLAIMEYLTSGITAVFDMYFHQEEVAKAMVDAGFRCVMCGSVNDFSGSTKELEELYLKYNCYHPLISYKLGFHAEYTTNEKKLLEISKLSHKYNAPVFTHNSESCKEVEDCIRRNGRTPTQYLHDLGIYEHGGGGFHCVHMSEEDLAIFKEKGLSVVTNPASNLKLASGIAPIARMHQKGIPVAIGTDGPASNNCLDMFREMFLVTGLQKVITQDAAVLSGDTVLDMATINGAAVLELDDCDVLAPGKKADIVMVDLAQPNMQPIYNISKNLVYSGSKQNVKMTMIDGRILYEDGRFYIGEEPEEVYKRVNKIMK